MAEHPNSNDLEHTGETFYPSFLFKEIVVMMSVFILVAIILALVFPVATAIIPSGGIVALLLLPFIDKNPEKRPTKRPIAMAIGLLAVAAFVVLTVIGVKS
jgi:quinol-cytochrome oxidoreductase complex cytochrome b subunit